jgi:ABC-type sugar transport system ATPase subunit
MIAFDKPISSLPDEESLRLLALIRRLDAGGVAVIYISHRLAEITGLADRVAALRDGTLVEDLPAEGITEAQITRLMVGRPLSNMFPARDPATGEVVLEVAGMTTEHVTDVSLRLRAGEVLGTGGLIGAGRSELAKGIFGFHRRSAGRMVIDGVELPPGDTAAAIAAGIGFAPEDRKEEALLLMQTILENAVLCVPQKVSSRGFFSRAKALGLITGISRQMRLKASSLDAPVTSLSGGYQQEVVLTRWLASDLKVLILDEPTRGMDVGARSGICDLIRSLNDTGGLGVIVISSELPELLGLSDRVLVMAEGRIRAEFDRSEASEETVMAAAIPLGQGTAAAELEGAGQGPIRQQTPGAEVSACTVSSNVSISLLVALAGLLVILGVLRGDVFFRARNLLSIGMGVAILGVLNNGMILTAVPTFCQMLAKGTPLILAVFLAEDRLNRS